MPVVSKDHAGPADSQKNGQERKQKGDRQKQDTLQIEKQQAGQVP
jgi:hypothetical protein